MKLQSALVGSVLSLFAIGGLSSLDAQPLIGVDKLSLSFTAQQGGPAVTQPLNVTGNSNGLVFNVTSNVSWLKVSPTSGSTPSALTVTADPAGLGPGTVTGALNIFSFNTIQVQVTLTVGPVSVTQQSLQVAYSLNGSIPAAQTLNITGQPVAFSASASTTDGKLWLQVAPTSGQAPATLSAIFNSQVLPTLAAGTYTGAINITAANQSISVPVTLTVASAPTVTVDTKGLVFNYQTGQAIPVAQSVAVTVLPAQQLLFNSTPTVPQNPAGKPWLTVTSPGTTLANGTATLSVSVDPTGLPVGTYSGGNIAIAVTSQGNPSVNIPVTLVVSALPLLNVPTTALNFTYQTNSAVPAAQSVAVTATSGTPNFSLAASSTPAGWLKVPATGTAPTPFSVTVDPTGLAKGTYSGTVTVTGVGTGNGAQTFAVTLTVSNDPVISVNLAGCTTPPSQNCALSIPFQTGGVNNPGATILTLNSSTGATLNYTVTPATTSCGNWLMVNGGAGAVTGATSNTVSLSANVTGIAAGTTCAGTIAVTATNASTGVAAPNSPVTIPVTLTVSGAAQLVVTPVGLTFTVPAGGQSSPSQVVSLTSTGSDQLNYTVAFTPGDTGGNWLSLNATAGATPGSITLTATPPSLLASGTYTGTLKITATGPGGAAVADSPFAIPVVLNLTAGTLVVSPILPFTQTLGGVTPATQTLQITSNGQPLTYLVAASNPGTVQWLSVTGNATGQTPGSVTVAVDGSKLSPGTYTGTVTVTAPGASNTPLPVTVTLTVSAGTISATPAALNFTQVGGGTPPAAQPVAVSGTPGPLNFTVATSTKDGGTWLSATPASGTANANVQVSVNAGNLAPGTYTGTVTISSAGAAGSPVNIAVNFTVTGSLTLVGTPSTIAPFSFVIGTAVPAGQTVQVTSSGTNAPFKVATSTKDGGTWLSATPASGTTPAPISIQVAPFGLAAGTYQGTVTVSSTNSLTPLSIPVTLTVTAIPTPVIIGLRNAASGSLGVVSPGENVAIYGTNIGPSPLVKGQLNASGLGVDTIASDTQVFFDEVAAPVLYASTGQTSVMVPYGVAGRTSTTITVAYKGVRSAGATYNIIAVAPGIYTLNLSGTGPGAIVNQDGSIVTAATPAPKGSGVAVYMTGEGLTAGNADGVIATGLKNPVASVTATVDGLPATVLYAGTAPGIVNGVMQVNVLIPAGASSGPAVPISITVGTVTTQAGGTLAIQ